MSVRREKPVDYQFVIFQFILCDKYALIKFYCLALVQLLSLERNEIRILLHERAKRAWKLYFENEISILTQD